MVDQEAEQKQYNADIIEKNQNFTQFPAYSAKRETLNLTVKDYLEANGVNEYDKPTPVYHQSTYGAVNPGVFNPTLE